MADVVYHSRTRVERIKGPLRRATIPGETEPVSFCVHGAVAEHYKVPPGAFPVHATTIDYLVASAAG
ncbi:MAG: hypothetical protein FJW39_09710 [Acidobacteria bacterium]|nr:hypothetical protein [Acidobacteriota bacterium]